MVSCYNCGTEMILESDFDFEDFNYEGEGVISCFSCSKCGTYAEFTIPFK